MAGLVPHSLRLDQDDPVLGPEVEDIIVEMADEQPTQEIAADGTIMRIFAPDGGVTVSLDGKGLGNVNPPTTTNDNWYQNLAEKIDDTELGRIANDLLRGIREDDQSRQEWIEARKVGIQLLGLKVEVPNASGVSDGAPVEGMSRVRHPLLLEAVLRFQANARSELLPTDGPVKVRNDDNDATVEEDAVATALQKDLNHYLTSTATEYYPDTDRMLLMLGAGGTSFKKVYQCPLRNRPVSESVDAEDLIVSSNATDLNNARRVTHKVLMGPSTVKRLQILGVYRDLDLSTPQAPTTNDAERERKSQQGISVDVMTPEDRDREIYECYCELNLRGYEHKKGGKETGLEIPYCVTIDVSSQQILSVVRNYDRATQELPIKRMRFVKYTFVPGLGFYDIGLLHILGNTTNALTAAWREMLDNGMFANFPGFLMADQGMRQNTNIFRVPPGGGAPVKTGGMNIRDAIMPLPYGTTHMPALQNLANEMAQTGARVGGTSEQQVGEGRADAPVGTTLAMIDQATKVLNSVHKRMHAAQAEEFALLVQVFRENPESFWQAKWKKTYPWDQAKFLQALNDYDLVPQADPNTASHTQRVMKVMALKQLQASSPDLYDPLAVDTVALQTLGWSSPTQFFARPGAEQQKPEIIKGLADMKANQTRADAAMLSAQASMKKADQDGLAGAEKPPSPQDQMEAQDKAAGLALKQDELKFKGAELMADMENEEKDRQADHHLALLQLARDTIATPQDDASVVKDVKKIDQGTAHA